MALLLRSCYATLGLAVLCCSQGQRSESEVLAAASRIYDAVSRSPDGYVIIGPPVGRPEIRHVTSGSRAYVEVQWRIGHSVSFEEETLDFSSYTHSALIPTSEEVMQLAKSPIAYKNRWLG